MAENQFAYVARDKDGTPVYGWDGKAWQPIAKPGPANRFATSAIGLEEGTNLNPLKPEFWAGGGDLGNWLTALKQAATSLNPIPGSRQAAQTGIDRFKSGSPVLGGAEYLESGIPYLGPMMVKMHEQARSGDLAGSYGTALTAGLTGAGMAKSAPAAAEAASRAAEIPKRTLRSWTGIGKTAEGFARESSAEDSAEAMRKFGEKTEEAKKTAGEKVAEREKAIPEASAAESVKGVKQSVSQGRGPVYQRLTRWSDRVNDVATKTQQAIKDAFNERYGKFREALGKDPQVSWTPVQEAVKEAEKSILQGSPESIALFRNIMKEGPQLDEASVFRSSQRTEAAANLKEMMQSRFMNEATKRRIEAQLAAQGVPVGATSTGSNVTEGLRIPHSDAWGYAQELNAKLHGAHLPSDVYRAIRFVKEEGIDPVLQEAADAANQGEAWKRIQKDYSEFAKRFLDKDSPAYKLLNTTNPEDRLRIVTGKEGQNLIDVLHKYREFGGDPEIAGKVRALQSAVEKLPQGSRSIPDRPELRLPEKPATAPFSPEEWRRQKLNDFAKMLSGASRYETRPYGLRFTPLSRGLARVLSNPAIVDWLVRGQ